MKYGFFLLKDIIKRYNFNKKKKKSSEYFLEYTNIRLYQKTSEIGKLIFLYAPASIYFYTLD